MKTSSQSGAANSAALGRTGLGTATGQRLPVPPRERKPALAALAVLLILGGALTSAYLVMASGQRVSAIEIAEPVAAGQQIPRSALREVSIGNTGIQFVRWSYANRVVGTFAAVPIQKGTLLTNAMMRSSANPAQGRVIVGLALKPGQLPAAGLQVGLRVGLYAVGGNDDGPRPGTLLSADAIVNGVARDNDSRSRSGDTMVDVAVPPADAPALLQAASAGAVAVALIPEGSRAVAPPRSGNQNTPPSTGGPSASPTNPAGG